MDKTELIAALEAAEGPSRELDGAICAHIGKDTWCGCTGACKAPPFICPAMPAYTRSIDAALRLVPEGWRVGSIVEGEIGPWFVSLWDRSVRLLTARAEGPTLPLALCIAALRARP